MLLHTGSGVIKTRAEAARGSVCGGQDFDDRGKYESCPRCHFPENKTTFLPSSALLHQRIWLWHWCHWVFFSPHITYNTHACQHALTRTHNMAVESMLTHTHLHAKYSLVYIFLWTDCNIMIKGGRSREKNRTQPCKAMCYTILL